MREDWSTLRKLMFQHIAGGGSLSEIEVTGNPVAFNTNVQKALTAFTIPFLPVQSGTGDPSPENVRQISGWTGVTAYRAGVNVLIPVFEEGRISASTGGNVQDDTYYRSKELSPVKAGEKYTTVWNGTYKRVYWYDKNGVFISSDTSSLADKTAPEGACYVRMAVPKVDVSSPENTCAINYPSTETEYIPYTGQSYPVTFPDGQTIYGGTLDAVAGVLSVEWQKAYLKNLSWYAYSGTRVFASNIHKDKTKDIFSDSFPIVRNYNNNESILVYTNGAGYADSIYFIKDGLASYDEFIEWLNGLENNPAIVFPLQTPLEIPLSDVPVPVTMKGDNTIWTDTNGSNTIKYKKKG